MNVDQCPYGHEIATRDNGTRYCPTCQQHHQNRANAARRIQTNEFIRTRRAYRDVTQRENDRNVTAEQR